MGDKNIFVHPYVQCCKNCHGLGVIYGTNRNGKYDRKICTLCKGSGRVRISKQITIKIEAYVSGYDDGLTVKEENNGSNL